MERLVKVLLYVWQLPQNLLGLLILCFYKCDMHFRVRSLTPETSDLASLQSGVTFTKLKKNKYCNPKVHICQGFKSGISLGDVIIINRYKYLTIRHEYGHSVQSLYFGPAYLLVIGLPSLLNNICRFTENYYDFWTENRADKLGGIKR